MLDKLENIKKRHTELQGQVSLPEVISDRDKWQKFVKELSQLEPIVEKYNEYIEVVKQMSDAEDAIKTESDKEMRELLNDEIYDSKKRLEDITEELKILLLPKDPDDDKNVVVEIRAGAGGDEAALFGTVLQRMYMRYAERNRWKVEMIDENVTDMGGVKEVVFIISGKGVYSRLKYESGVHRVQRVPETESQGRVHTSTTTVAVLPEAEDVEIEIEEKDIKVDTYRSSGAGGQHVNKTESAIRITHLPTGIVVQCQDEKSQIKNRVTAMKVLKSRLYDHFQQEANKKYAENRKTQVGTGDRSERIRTYNFPQGRVSDHRIGMTLYSLDTFVDGDIDEMIDALAIADRNAKMQSAQE